MALHNLKITVVDGGKSYGQGWGSGLNKAINKGDSEKSLLYKMLHINDTMKRSIKKAVSPTTFFAIQSGIEIAMKTGRQFINYYISDIGRRHGDSNYQAIINRRIEIITDALSLGQGFISGAGAGSIVGPAGAVVGAIVGTVSAGVDLGFKYAERERAYQHEMFKENNNQAYSLSRANYSALTGRVR